MGMSASKTKSTSKETLAPSTYSQPYIDQAVKGVNTGGQQSQDLLKQFMPQAQKSLGYYDDVMGGKFLGGNPYMDGMIQQTGENVSNRVNSNFSSSGRYGSDYHTGELTRGLADAVNNMRFSNYANERGMQNQAAMGNLASIKDILIPQAEVMARALGCGSAQIASREAWAKALKSSGYELHQTTIKKVF